jgi:ABC-2 type transport system permease protein
VNPEAPTRRGVHDRLAGLDAGSPPAFDPGRTLRLRVEFSRQLRRRRTQFAAAAVIVLPIVVALAFQLGGSGSGSDQNGPNGSVLVSLATVGAANFAMFTEFASVGFLLVVLVALFCGDTVASEASWSSLRYLLSLPVPRARLLRQKLIVALTLSLAVNLLLPAWGFAVGAAFFGTAPARSPLGGTFTVQEALWRLTIVATYSFGQSLVVAALAFLLSVSVDNPLGAVGSAVLLVVISNILDQITALGQWRRYLPTHFQFSWLDALGPSIVWDDIMRGTAVALIYAAIFFGIAWLRFDRKDITS